MFCSPLVSEKCIIQHDAGVMNVQCSSCEALHFHEEKISNHFNDCCHNGKVVLPLIRVHPMLKDLITKSDYKNNFLTNIRQYNSAMAFGSLTTQFPIEACGNKPPILRIRGEIFHNIGTLHPKEGDSYKYAQLYILDTEQALQQRIKNNLENGCIKKVFLHYKMLCQIIRTLVYFSKCMNWRSLKLRMLQLMVEV